jgi:hypothetical protein
MNSSRIAEAPESGLVFKTKTNFPFSVRCRVELLCRFLKQYLEVFLACIYGAQVEQGQTQYARASVGVLLFLLVKQHKIFLLHFSIFMINHKQ